MEHGWVDWADQYRRPSSSSFLLLSVSVCAIVELKIQFGIFALRPQFAAREWGNMDGAELSNIKKWIVMYPVYINSKKTMAEGRRIGLAKACENPTCAEIGDCCSYLKLPFAIEVRCFVAAVLILDLFSFSLGNLIFYFYFYGTLQIDKAYPRDFMQRGRVRVLLKKEDGTLFNSAISSSKI